MTSPAPTRRRVLFVGATLLGAAVLGGPVAAAPVQRWRGVALGAGCTIELVGARDDAVFADVEAEIRRLEAIFGLYRADGQLVRLNRDGVLADPAPELVELLALAGTVHAATGGLFDPTVQPLFDLYARHFAAPGADPAGPSRAAVAAALARVGFSGVEIAADRIRLARPGMALTLNGIAQGFVTDRVAARLAAHGYGDMLLDVGEIRAAGSRAPAGDGWTVGVDRGGRRDHVRLRDEAIATSAPLGTVLDPAGRFGHVFDPRRGWTGGARRAASVIAPTAALADAVSTAAVLMDDADLSGLARLGVRVLPG
ncbi:FAD:protein FMN transferase [Oharaeibacter diazotrophicus]|uniref:FAD:protein FMN transferase n=3 Tax=Oharaeibacter diazotrophicus TaxID=1920512 RepID=A0A4R6RII6_9HYPH|nr:FAD:protein FMN transferase [Oharaeibacter diazotrophicus]TDP85466.1 thiamine biosynthesis lipoprotein [Oharaeibacter diazotrophicus]BBE74436.1 thiamine biosynthesis lipoprotein ApbE precursor [Pleomorphomonas sp. SM30]GLS75868.1 FAD:protein FMN transferase [Oharaeibacter diazotrophicus]